MYIIIQHVCALLACFVFLSRWSIPIFLFWFLFLADFNLFLLLVFNDPVPPPLDTKHTQIQILILWPMINLAMGRSQCDHCYIALFLFKCMNQSVLKFHVYQTEIIVRCVLFWVCFAICLVAVVDTILFINFVWRNFYIFINVVGLYECE